MPGSLTRHVISILKASKAILATDHLVGLLHELGDGNLNAANKITEALAYPGKAEHLLGARLVTVPEHDRQVLLALDFIHGEQQHGSLFKHGVEILGDNTGTVHGLSELHCQLCLTRSAPLHTQEQHRGQTFRCCREL